MSLTLQFSRGEIPGLVERYLQEDARRRVRDSDLQAMSSAVAERSCLTLHDLHLVGRWKSPRSANLVLANDAKYVEEITGIALSTQSEQVRIEVLTVMAGVGWPMASVILHWFHRDDYPILDFRALESIGAPANQQYNFQFWTEYTNFCRDEASANGITGRELDQALWMHSYEAERQSSHRATTVTGPRGGA